MEVLEVPTSVGLTTDSSLKSSFYSPYNTIEYSAATYPFHALKDARDCHLNNSECVQVLPEVWNGQEETWQDGVRNGLIESAGGNGMVGKISWFLPKFAWLENPELVTYKGLQGEENRKKMNPKSMFFSSIFLNGF